MMQYSLIIPAFNEEAYLSRTLTAVRRAMEGVEPAGEVIVVDNNSDDRTAEIAAAGGARVIFERVNQISRARNAGATTARGRWLVFVDADTLLSAELLGRALGNLASNRICGGGATIEPDKPLKPLLALGLRFWNWFSVGFEVAAGSFVYCRRDAFAAVGGFSEKVFVGEELWFSVACKKWGKRRGQAFRIIDHAPVITSVRKLEWFSSRQTVLMLISMAFFPLISRHRRLCRYWYIRPTSDPTSAAADHTPENTT